MGASGVFDLTRTSNFEAHLRWSRFESVHGGGLSRFFLWIMKERGCRGALQRVAASSRVHGIIPQTGERKKRSRERFTFVVQLSRGFPSGTRHRSSFCLAFLLGCKAIISTCLWFCPIYTARLSFEHLMYVQLDDFF